MSEQIQVESRHLGSLGPWRVEQLILRQEDNEMIATRWVGRLTRPEKMLKKPTKHKRAKLMLRRTEVLISTEGSGVIAYSFLISEGIGKPTIGQEHYPPDPIPIELILKLAELKHEHENQHRIIIPGEQRMIVPKLIPPKNLKGDRR